jgi:hypothetical protein
MTERKMMHREPENDQMRRKSLVSEASQRLVETRQEKGLSYRSNSLRKIVPWESITQKEK